MKDISKLDFDEIKSDLKEFIRNNSNTDVDYEGSNTSLILDLLSYVSQNQSYYLNQSVKESFLDSAQLRDSVVSHAKTVGYVPKSIRASSILVTLKFKEPTQETTIPAGTEIYAKLYGVTKKFITLYASTIENNQATIRAYQGELKTIEFDYLDKILVLPDPNIDRDTFFKVSVIDHTDKRTEYKKVRTLTKGNVFYLQEGKKQSTELYFGKDNYGTTPELNDTIKITYLITDGEHSNGCKDPFINSIISNTESKDIECILNEESSAGDRAESLAEIKFMAPMAMENQQRAITKQDYLSIILQKFSDIEDINVWGGEDNLPPEHGVIFLCIKPKSSDVLSYDKKLEYIEYLKDYSIVGIKVKIKNPEFLFCDYKIKIKTPYWININDSKGEIFENVNKSINEYMDNVPGFNKGIHVSNISTLIDQHDNIDSNIIKITISKRIDLSLAESYIDFGNKIVPGSLYTNGLMYKDQSYKIIDNGQGLLYFYNEYTKNIDFDEIGSVDYNIGLVKINLNLIEDLKVYIEPEEGNIITNKNVIIKKNSVLLEYI
jgi:hypothetical protein